MISSRSDAVHHRLPEREARGFTLIELMVAITILAVLLAWAVPSFNNAALSSKLTGFANDLVSSTQIARSEAIKRNAPITLCASSNGTTCATSGGWEVGWILLRGTTVLQHHQALPTEFRIVQNGTFGALTFPPDVVGTTAATFKVCRAVPVGHEERTVRVTTSGGTAVARTATATCP
jgi:type IV fimbrial biogenesis protein FimT